MQALPFRHNALSFPSLHASYFLVRVYGMFKMTSLQKEMQSIRTCDHSVHSLQALCFSFQALDSHGRFGTMLVLAFLMILRSYMTKRATQLSLSKNSTVQGASHCPSFMNSIFFTLFLQFLTISRSLVVMLFYFYL